MSTEFEINDDETQTIDPSELLPEEEVNKAKATHELDYAPLQDEAIAKRLDSLIRALKKAGIPTRISGGKGTYLISEWQGKRGRCVLCIFPSKKKARIQTQRVVVADNGRKSMRPSELRYTVTADGIFAGNGKITNKDIVAEVKNFIKARWE